MRYRMLASLVAVFLFGPAMAEEEAEVITSVDMQKIAANSLLKDLKLEKSETGDCPARHLYYFRGDVIVAVSVHPTKTEAQTLLDHVRRGISIGGVSVEGLGDDAETTEERRYDFRQNNVVIGLWGSRAIADSIATALKSVAPKGKAIEAPKVTALGLPEAAKPGEHLEFVVKLVDVKEPKEIKFTGAFPVQNKVPQREGDVWTYTLEQNTPLEKGPFRLELEILAPGNIVIVRTTTIEIR